MTEEEWNEFLEFEETKKKLQEKRDELLEACYPCNHRALELYSYDIGFDKFCEFHGQSYLYLPEYDVFVLYILDPDVEIEFMSAREMSEEMSDCNANALYLLMRKLGEQLKDLDAELVPRALACVSRFCSENAEAMRKWHRVYPPAPELNLEGLDLSGLAFEGIDFSAFSDIVRFRDVDLSGCVFTDCKVPISFKDCDLSGAKFAGCNATPEYLTFENCTAPGMSFEECSFIIPSFKGCSLSGCLFKDTWLGSPLVDSCDLSGSRFNHVDLDGGDGVRFRGCDLLDAHFDDVSYIAEDLNAVLACGSNETKGMEVSGYACKPTAWKKADAFSLGDLARDAGSVSRACAAQTARQGQFPQPQGRAPSAADAEGRERKMKGVNIDDLPGQHGGGVTAPPAASELETVLNPCILPALLGASTPQAPVKTGKGL